MLRGLHLMRTVKSLTRTANEALDAVMTTASGAEARASALSAHTERLTQTAERLQISLARLAVLRAAADEVKRSVNGLRGAVPRK